jgi:XTP/dITP diphosphohydrolase
MEILFASSNLHKLGEIRALFEGYSVVCPKERGITFEAEENGLDFFDNALIKARALEKLWHGPVLADDSGICVDALNGAPGIHSARFGSEGGAKLSDSDRNALLLKTVGDNPFRTCRFVCCMVLTLGPGRFLAAQETIEGELLREPHGTQGFGYDPLVYIPSFGRSVAELSEEEKNKISHRGKAARRIIEALRAIED